MSDKLTDARVIEVENEEGQRFALVNLWVEVIQLRAENERHRRAADEIERLCAENERLREALRLCRSKLEIAALFRGYEGGPLQEPSTKMVLHRAEAALKGDSDE